MTNQNDRNRDRRSNAAGNNQRDREQQQRQGNTKGGTKPWGRAVAVIDVPGQQRSETKARFVPIGAVWETEHGSLRLVLEAQPNQWSDPHYRRTVIITRNEDK